MVLNVVKVLKYLERNQKGQGIVEYALLLAFIVGIAMMLNGANLGNAVKGVFDDTAELIASFTDSRSPEEKDYANMKNIGMAMANSFSFSNSVAARNKVDSDGKLVSQKNFSVLYVFPDGTADLFVDGDGYTSSFWLSDAKLNNDPRASLYEQTLINAGININDKSAMKINSASDGGNLQNGYAVVLDKNGASFWGNTDSNFNASTYKSYTTQSNSTSPGNLAQYAAGYNVQSIYHNQLEVD